MSILIQGSRPHLLPTSVVILITQVLAIWLTGVPPLRLLMMAVRVSRLISCVYRRDCDFRGLCQVHARFTWGLYVGLWVSDLSKSYWRYTTVGSLRLPSISIINFWRERRAFVGRWSVNSCSWYILLIRGQFFYFAGRYVLLFTLIGM